MSDQALLRSQQGGVVTITHDDGRANVYRNETFERYFELLDEIEGDDDARAVVLRGRPGFFSAGMDLKWMQQIERDELGRIGPNMAKLAHRLFIFKKPLIAAVTGHAVAGGAIVLLACDRSVGVEGDYLIGLNEVDLGIPFGGFGMKLAQAHLSPAAFGSGLLYGETFKPDRAREIGYLDEVVPANDFDARVLVVAERAAGLSPFAYQATKQAMRAELAEEINEQATNGSLVPLFQAFADLHAA